MKRAFTLIELLVVIAIIAILAAILFPVFAQAKASAKATQSISNMKQIGTGLMMYLADYDDTYMPRRVQGTSSTGQPGEYSWKQVEYPYVKNQNLFGDPMNTAAKYPDDCSDPTLRASWGQVVIGPVLARGYSFFDGPWLLQKSWSATTITQTAIEQPASTIAVAEQKRVWVDTGPWLNWDKNDWDPVTGTVGALGWPWGGSKWEDKAMVIVFHDGHAKRMSNGGICGKDNELNAWGYIRNQLSNYGGLGDVTWVDTFCQTIPTGMR